MEMWAERTKRIMREKRVTQEKLAEAIGCTQGALSHWFSGRRAIDLKTIESIAGALGITANELIAGQSDMVAEGSPEYDECEALARRIERLPPEDQARVTDLIDRLLAE